MNNILYTYVLPSIIAYLLGSISFPIIITWLFSKKDIRDFGSGNAGGTNVLRSVGKFAGILTMVLDILKCVIAVLIAKYLIPGGENAVAMSLAGLFCILGHMFPVYFSFKGGKGVACGAGMILVLDIRLFFVLIVVFIITLLITRFVSLSSMLSALSFPIATFILTEPENQLISTVIALFVGGLVIFMHRSNIRKLINHTENKISFKKK